MNELTFSTWQCMKTGCGLTALWQCGIDVTPKWRLSATPLHCIFSIVVCGLCKENVTPKDFTGWDKELEVSLNRPSSDFNLVLTFYDISDGYWIDPRKPNTNSFKKVRMPDSPEAYSDSLKPPGETIEIHDINLMGDDD